MEQHPQRPNGVTKLQVPLGSSSSAAMMMEDPRNGSTKSASSSALLQDDDDNSNQSLSMQDFEESFANLNDEGTIGDDTDDGYDESSRRDKFNRSQSLSQSLRTAGGDITGEDEIELEQTAKVRMMKLWFYVTVILSGITSFLLTYFLIDKATTEWDDVEIHPAVYAIISPFFILSTSLSMFRYYDRSVYERHETVLMNAQRTGHIVASLFPKVVQRRIWADAAEAQDSKKQQQQQQQKTSSIMNARMSSIYNTTAVNNNNNARENALTSGNYNMNKSMANLLPAGSLHQAFSVTGRMTEFLDGDSKHAAQQQQPSEQPKKKPTTKPIADLFPAATIFFGDLVGFTAWSSMREPSQVFTLLEAIYNEFDEIARRRRVFKVETVGDCYVAVAGLPEPCVNHAQVMARFAWDCRLKMNDLVKELEVTLGPDTTELAIRIGLHSGPVTAGVLRGDRARFQLFGDTVNTTSRIETTGKADRIHVSQECAQLLTDAAKDHWLTPREDKVTAKGKGELSTFWLSIAGPKRRSMSIAMGGDGGSVSSLNNTSNNDVLHSDENNNNDKRKSKSGNNKTNKKKHKNDNNNNGNSSTDDDANTTNNNNNHNNAGGKDLSDSDIGKLSDKHERLVNWITNELATLLKEIEIQRMGSVSCKDDGDVMLREIVELEHASTGESDMKEPSRPLDEVEDIITLPKFESMDHSLKLVSREKLELSETVLSELHSYVHTLATMYPENPFHNFEHASHVTMSVCKLLSRIVRPADINVAKTRDVASTLHDHTYGITSDPLTQFAVVLSALIHDVDHPGIPNTQLIVEKPRLADFYKNKSLAEQNSVDLAWTLLMDDGFTNLRGAIYGTPSEFKRFRQLIVNSVMATDIMDKDLSVARKTRWNKAFSNEIMDVDDDNYNADDDVNRKATIVIEHLIQASDIAHTMQHWHIYRKWNGRLFEEMYKAFVEGRSGNNPADNWYQGEIGFFKFYIIPLAHKLKECGVFGVSGDEYLNYAQQNLREWELNGKNVVRGMVDTMKFKHVPKPQDSPKLMTTKIGDDPSKSNTSNTSKTTVPGASPAITSRKATAEIAMPMPPKPIQPVQSAEILKKMITSVPTAKKDETTLKELPDTMNVLFVDDDKITRKLFSRSLKKILPQWTVQEAASGEEALALIDGTEKPFDLIFMDFYMGTDNKQLLGSEAVAELRKRGINAKVCGMSANDVENMFEDAGADEFSFKPLPFRPQPLTEELNRILSINDDWGVVALK